MWSDLKLNYISSLKKRLQALRRWRASLFKMGKQRFPQFSEREFLATIQNGGGRWGLSHSGRHKQLSFSRPPCRPRRSAVLPPPPAKPFRGIAWDWLIGWGGEAGLRPQTGHHHFLLWAVVSCRCLVTMGEIMAAWATFPERALG